jgi:hypothetical protein
MVICARSGSGRERPNVTGALTAQRFSLPGNQVKREVNKLYKLLEIDIDGIYKTVCMGGGQFSTKLVHVRRQISSNCFFPADKYYQIAPFSLQARLRA